MAQRRFYNKPTIKSCGQNSRRAYYTSYYVVSLGQWSRNEFESGGVDMKKNCVVPLHFFGSKVQLVVLVSTFVVISAVSSVSCLPFF